MVFVLAIVTYDGLMATPLWLRVRTLATPAVEALGIPGIGGLYLIQTLGLIAVPLLFLAAYLGFVKLAQVLSGGATSAWQLAAAYARTLSCPSHSLTRQPTTTRSSSSRVRRHSP
jgi:hypothetical protein